MTQDHRLPQANGTEGPASAAQEGGAKRRRTSHAVDQALAERARNAAQRLTGLETRINAGKLELHFGDETGLAELAETLEAL